MSADNGIYVLYTDSEKGPEYRVTFANAIGNIYGEWDDKAGKYAGSLDCIRDTFGDAPVFYSLNEALDYAEQEDSDRGVTEDGICVINEFNHLGHVFEDA
jgi:hypothetical protein